MQLHSKKVAKGLKKPQQPPSEERKTQSKFAMATLFTWRTMVLTGKGQTTVSRLWQLICSDNEPKVGDLAPDCVLHRLDNLEEVMLSSFFKPHRLTVLNFGSYT